MLSRRMKHRRGLLLEPNLLRLVTTNEWATREGLTDYCLTQRSTIYNRIDGKTSLQATTTTKAKYSRMAYFRSDLAQRSANFLGVFPREEWSCVVARPKISVGLKSQNLLYQGEVNRRIFKRYKEAMLMETRRLLVVESKEDHALIPDVVNSRQVRNKNQHSFYEDLK